MLFGFGLEIVVGQNENIAGDRTTDETDREKKIENGLHVVALPCLSY